jgi:glycosyltransferase involved in cell wall biosynthesis
VTRPRLAVVASHPVQYYAPLFRELARRLELSVFYAHRASAEDQAAAGFGVAFEWDSDLLSGYAHRFLRNVARQPRLDAFGGCDTPEIGARLREGGFDAVMLFGWRLKSDLQAGLAAKRLGLPILVRGDSQLATPRSPLRRLAKAIAYPPLLRLADAALYVGERSRAYWARYGYPASRTFFSPHSVDAAWFANRATPQAREALRARLGIRTEAAVALFAGKLAPFKRPLDVVEAAARLRRDGAPVTVLVAGAGELAGAMADAARRAGVDLHPLGFCNQTQMPEVYAASDVLVLPSDSRETWGLVANEALACCRPVVLSDQVGAAPDLAADGDAGRVFRGGDAADLAAALGQVLTQPPSSHRIAAKSAAYSLVRAADGVEEALARVRRPRS